VSVHASAAALRAGLDQAVWRASDLWIASVGVGGAFSQADVRALAAGDRDIMPTEHDILAAAINGYLSDRGREHRVPYWSSL
jgi:hypothetical protein